MGKMTKQDEIFSNVKKTGTGHILQDLLSSTVLLQRSKFDPPHIPPKIMPPPELTSSCLICSESGTNLSPLAIQEMEILTKFVINQEQISLILQTEDHPPIFCCKICSSAILSLAKLSTQIENITISLRAVISSRNGLFNKLRNRELSQEIGTNNDSPMICDDPQELNGFIEEEEFLVKIEPADDDDDDDEATIDPLYEPDSSEIDDDDDNTDLTVNETRYPPTPKDNNIQPDISQSAAGLERSDTNTKPLINVGSNFVCTICQPNVTFASPKYRRAHMRNKNIHPDLAAAFSADAQARRASKKISCKICGVRKFSSKYAVTVHMKNKHSNGNSSSAINSDSSQRLVPQNPSVFPCQKCDKSFTSFKSLHRHRRAAHEWIPFRRKCTLCPQVFTYQKLLEKHMGQCHNVAVGTTNSTCSICLKTFATPTTMHRHVELAHFPDKTACPYGCETTKFGSVAEWVTHLEGCDSPKMSGESECTCTFCPAVFRNILLQIEHRLRVHPKTTYNCSICKKSFTRQFFLDYHQCSTSRGNGTKSGTDVVARARFVCNIFDGEPAKICGMHFKIERSLWRHMTNKNIHPDTPPAKSAEKPA